MSEQNISRRVVMLTHVFPRTLADPMGAFLLHLTDALAARDVTIDVIAPHAPNLADAEMIGEARVHRFHYAPARWERLAYTGTMHDIVGRGIGGKFLFALFSFAFFFKTLAVVRAARPHILHAHWWLPGGLIGALVSLITRAPLVITTHGTDVEMLRQTQWAMPLARFVFSRARVITCGSTYLRDQLLTLKVADVSRVTVLPMPVNPLFEISDFGFQISDSKILTVTRLTKQKSIDTLIAALAILRERGSNARLTIIGDGPERAGLEKQTRDLSLQDRVEFLGALPQTELPKHYAMCAIFVLPSIREGMGLVLAEALLCGAPVIAANSGGVTDIVHDGATGLLFPERDSHVLATAIERFLNDRELATRLAANGRAWVRERYAPEKIAARFSETYRQCLQS